MASTIAVEGIAPPADLAIFGGVSNAAADMVDAICQLLTDPSRSAQIGRRARLWAESHFKFDRTVSTAVREYLRLVHNPDLE